MPASSTEAGTVTVAVLDPHMQKAVAGVAPIAPTVNVQLGDGVGLTETVGVGLEEGLIDGDAAAVGVTDGVEPGVLVGEGVDEGFITGVAVRAAGVPHEEPIAPDGRVHGWTAQRTAREQSRFAISVEARQMFGHGRAQINPFRGVDEHGLTRHVGERPTQSCCAEACAAMTFPADAVLGTKQLLGHVPSAGGRVGGMGGATLTKTH